jgi:hypothetical protein
MGVRRRLARVDIPFGRRIFHRRLRGPVYASEKLKLRPASFWGTQGNSTYFFQSPKQLKLALFFEEKITAKAPKAHKERKIRLYTKTFCAFGALVVKILPNYGGFAALESKCCYPVGHIPAIVYLPEKAHNREK